MFITLQVKKFSSQIEEKHKLILPNKYNAYVANINQDDAAVGGQ